MGRRKREVKMIEDKTSRQVTFSKRRAGLMKKAKQFSILCDADVAVLVVSSRGKAYDFCSTGSLDNLLHRYNSYAEANGKEGAGANAETSDPEGKGFLSVTELLEQAKRVSGQRDADQLNLTDLVHLEEQLLDALAETRSKMGQELGITMAGLIEKEMILSEKNRLLQEKITESESALDVKKKGITMELLAADEGASPGKLQEHPTAIKFL